MRQRGKVIEHHNIPGSLIELESGQRIRIHGFHPIGAEISFSELDVQIEQLPIRAENLIPLEDPAHAWDAAPDDTPMGVKLDRSVTNYFVGGRYE